MFGRREMKACETSLVSTGRVWANYVITRSRDLQGRSPLSRQTRRASAMVSSAVDHLANTSFHFCAGFWTPAAAISPAHGRPASKKRQGTKSRSAGRRLGGERYGDFRLAPHSMLARHRGGAARMPACGGGRGSGRSVPAGSEGYRRAPGGWIARNRVERDRRRRGAGARERQSGGADRRVWLMTCRLCLASAATSARSRARRPR